MDATPSDGTAPKATGSETALLSEGEHFAALLKSHPGLSDVSIHEKTVVDEEKNEVVLLLADDGSPVFWRDADWPERLSKTAPKRGRKRQHGEAAAIAQADWLDEQLKPPTADVSRN